MPRSSLLTTSFVVFVNRVGGEESITFWGGSEVIDRYRSVPSRARELGVPCVIGTSDGTRRIRTGDRLRVDGSNGRVEILERAPAEEQPA